MMTRRRWGQAVVGAWTMTRAMAGTPTFKTHLSPGALGIKVDQRQAIELASRHGFQAVEPNAGELAKLPTGAVGELRGELVAKRLVWGVAGLPVEFRRDQGTFDEGVRRLPETARALRGVGVERVGTYVLPSHASLTYRQNFQQHAERLGQVAGVLADNGLRLGIEYVGPRTLLVQNCYPFIHTMAEMRELISAMNRPGVGLVLDSWHWYTAGETGEDLRALTNRDIVAVDLNDAPAGVPVEQQIDSKRELPMATGVIDVRTFLNGLQRAGFDGPVRVEPFNETVRRMTPDEAAEAAKRSLDRAFATLT